MLNLDSLKEINKIDTGNVLSSIEMFPDQLKQAWDEMQGIAFDNYKNINNIVISGMGGSALGGRLIDSLVDDNCRVPIEVFTEYKIPSYANKNTLVIISSYSGETEETISALYNALKANTKIFILTTGGKLGKLAQKYQVPAYIYNPKYNPCLKPRMAVGYSISAIFNLLIKGSFITIGKDEYKETIEKLVYFNNEFCQKVPEKENIAKLTAKKLKGFLPVIVVSQHLKGSAHFLKNQLNETAKLFSTVFDLPELNHHLMEGLRNPAKIKEYLKFLFIESELYHERIKKRYAITKEVVGKNDIDYLTYSLRSKTRLLQVFELLSYSLYVAFYLAILYDIDPKDIPWVDYFKKKLS